MANQTAIIVPDESPALPKIRTIGTGDLRDALARGLDDFYAKPSHMVFLGVIYPVVGLILARMTMGAGLLPLVYPLIAGFALIGPFAAIGLYELSRRREQGLEVSWGDVFHVLRSPSIGAIALLGAGLMVIFVVWLMTAKVVYQVTLGGEAPASMTALIGAALTTPSGWALITLGNGIGFLFATLVLCISVVSFPLLLDRNVGAATAVQTSIRAVAENPLPMAAWGLIVAGALVLGSLPLFVGLAVVMPVLGHSTWHLYRKVVEPEAAT